MKTRQMVKATATSSLHSKVTEKENGAFTVKEKVTTTQPEPAKVVYFFYPI